MAPDDADIPRWLQAFPPSQRAHILESVNKIVAQAPPLTDEVVARLQAILGTSTRPAQKDEVA